jgi:protein SCO1/2
VDQSTADVRLSQFAGKLVALTFIYTTCPLPNYCLRLSNNFGRMQERFRDRMGKDLVLLSVTFDPLRDQPPVLAEYAKRWAGDKRGWHFLTGPLDDVKRVARSFGQNFWPDEGRVTHGLHTFVIGRDGRLVADLEGNEFTSQQLGDLLAAQLASTASR